MAKAEYQHTETDWRNNECTVGYCSNCGAKVRRSAHGTDEECPNCDADIDWFAKENEDE